MNENTTVNIAGYKFQPLKDAAELISLYQKKCDELELKGTMLISKNGINFSLAGTKQAIDKIIFFPNFNHILCIPTPNINNIL